MKIRTTTIPGCLRLQLVVHEVVGDRYVAVADPDDFPRHGMATRFARTFRHTFPRGTLSGLHLVRPPHAQDTLLYCVEGALFAAVVDLRVGSPAQHAHQAFTLEAARADMLYVPAGVAHGFRVQSDAATVVHQVTTDFPPDGDGGVLWNSAGIPWPEPDPPHDPLLDPRDLALPEMARFRSPFAYDP